MDRIFRTAFLLVPVILTLSCTPETRTVENPLIDTANTFTLDISKVEISDSATVLYINADYIPHYWIRISSDTYLAAKGRKYPMTGTDGIQADSLYWMPDSGTHLTVSRNVIFLPPAARRSVVTTRTISGAGCWPLP